MNITERLREIIDYLGLTPNAFAAKIGISQPRMRNYLTGRDPDFETLSQICITFVNIDPRWLLTGDGDMLLPSVALGATNPSASTLELAIIKTQAETILKQQQFINDHFMELHQKKISPPRVGEEYPDKEHIKE
ncbi:hypothetical protein A3BBH6_10510 [Alistipes onderdonkii subsp. vulgaris]|uniref:helix-turn-helix domain-containing protein n=1 Tax=Alistipes onderdonkii TaxID=328813 RepID=UPI001142AE26|nr:helix-turn-helix transcriptional regulator [Alistipes onderdonkii]BBL00815.1 hypothetical protein A3BBH6_10510 [Alistipes onderdonkii subsp. vulgaris]